MDHSATDPVTFKDYNAGTVETDTAYNAGAPNSGWATTPSNGWTDTSRAVRAIASRNFKGIQITPKVWVDRSSGTIAATVAGEGINDYVYQYVDESESHELTGLSFCPGDSPFLYTEPRGSSNKFIMWDFDPYYRPLARYIVPTQDATVTAYYGPEQYWYEHINSTAVAHAIYDDNFQDCGFDGVFLDRIRTQSFVSGVSGVLSCGCPVCKEYFKAEGVDLDAVQAAWIEKGDAFFSVTAYSPEDGFTFADPRAEAYFKAKGHVVSHAVAAIADSFRGRGLEVGMDLYAPFMAQFVGQDYGILSQHADFIKPMLYRQTFAPAGMGFEYDLLRKAVPGAEGYPEFVMDVDFLDSQLKAMEPYACGKYPGIEINYRAKVAPTSPEYVTESLEAVMRHGFDGAVLSWNIMQAPDSHISCLGKR
jgi:hypothetical protein